MHVFHTFRTESIRPVFGVYHPVDEAFRQSKGREADLVQLTVRYRYDNSNTEPNWLHVGSWAIHEHRIFSFYYFFVVVFLFLAAGNSFPSTCFGHRVKAIDFIQYTENISFYQKWERHNTTHTHTLAVLVCIARVVIMYPCWIQTFKHIIIIWLVDSSFVPAKCSMQCPIKPNNEQKKKCIYSRVQQQRGGRFGGFLFVFFIAHNRSGKSGHALSGCWAPCPKSVHTITSIRPRIVVS